MCIAAFSQQSTPFRSFLQPQHVLESDSDKARAVHSPHLSDVLPCAYLTEVFHCSFVSLKAFLQCLLLFRCCSSKPACSLCFICKSEKVAAYCTGIKVEEQVKKGLLVKLFFGPGGKCNENINVKLLPQWNKANNTLNCCTCCRV